MATTSAIVSQLRTLEHLTRVEAALARARVSQARTDTVRRELTDNAAGADRRGTEISAALRDLDAVPDLAAPTLGWLSTLLRTTRDQSRPIEEALLGDLALEHQLADRARYLLALTQHGPVGVHRLAEHLLAAHSETIAWLQTVLAEAALNGPSALRPTPLQAVAGGVSRVAGLPGRLTMAGVNRTAAQLSQIGLRARQEVTETGGRVVRIAEDTRDVVVSGVDAAAERAEVVARRDDASTTAGAVHTARREAGTLQASELPIADYELLTAKDVAVAVQKLSAAPDLAALQNYEERHRNRSGVLTAIRDRSTELAREASALS